MKKGDRIRIEGYEGTVVGESGLVNIFKNKLIQVHIDNEPGVLYLKDETELELI